VFDPCSSRVNSHQKIGMHGKKSMKLRVGKPAPDFSLTAHDGSTVRLRDFRGRNVVLAFFPLAWTPI
jgi:peroxiredoxin